MRYAPLASCLRSAEKIVEIVRPRHGRVGDCPNERSACEVECDQYDPVCQSYRSEMERRSQIGKISHPTRVRPGKHQSRQGKRADQDAGAERGCRTQSAAARLCSLWKQLFDKLLQPFA